MRSRNSKARRVPPMKRRAWALASIRLPRLKMARSKEAESFERASAEGP